jgi:hypothetical protein
MRPSPKAPHFVAKSFVPASEFCGRGISVTQCNALKEASQEIRAIAQSAEFQWRLASVDAMRAGEHNTITGEELLSSFTARRVPITYELLDRAHQTASTGVPDLRRGVTTILGPANFERWPPSNDRAATLQKACFLNTLSHEWVHAIPGSNRGWLCADDGHKDSTLPVAPYVLGSLVQCTFLVEKGLVSKAAIWKCVDAAGTNVFNGLSVCENDNWLSML